MTERDPHDRELQDYLDGRSKLSARYREASRETAPPELDEAVLRYARGEAVRGRARRWLMPAALAATALLGVNIAWLVYERAPAPAAQEAAPPTFAPAARVEPLAESREEMPAELKAKIAQTEATRRARAQARTEAVQKQEAEAAQRPRAEGQARRQVPADLIRDAAPASGYGASAGQDRAAQLREAPVAELAPDAASMPAAPPRVALTESAKIERLIDYVAQLPDARFIRNGQAHGPGEAAEHLRLKLRKAGDRVRTAQDFIRLCASGSSVSGEPYRIRFADGSERLSADVLNEQLSALEAGR